MSDGWISIHRKITEKGYYKDSEYVHLWLHLLIKANHEPNQWLYKNEIFKVKRGQFITSRKSLAKETGINSSKVERILKCFKIEQQIEQQNLYSSRLITILNYNDYQKVNSKMNTARTASEQPVNTNNNDNKDNNKDKGVLFSKAHPLSVKVVKTFLETLEEDSRYRPQTDAQKLKWMETAQWAINRMGKHGCEKVIDIIELYRSGNMDNGKTEFKWSENWKSLLKLNKKNKEDVYYLDYFWEKIKEDVEYGSQEKQRS